MANNCPMCGTPNSEEVPFCSACGSPLSNDAEHPPEDKQPDPPSASAPATARTVYGMAPVAAPAPEQKPEQTQQPPVAVVSPGPEATPASSQKPLENKKTVMGVMSPLKTGAVAPSATGAPAAEAKRPPMAVISEPEKPTAPQAPAQKENKTVLGLPAVGRERPAEPKPAAQSEQPAEKTPSTNHMEKPASTGSPVKAAKPAAPPQPSDPWPEREPSRPRIGALVAVIVVGILILVGIGILLYLLLGSQTKLEPQVFPTADGKEITVAFSFPKAPPGSTIQVADQTAQIILGQAQIRLKTSYLKLGTNNLPSMYTEPGKQPEASHVPIVLRHAILNDLSGLAAEKAFVEVHFQVAPGIHLAVEGNPVQTPDVSYKHRIPLSQIDAVADTSGDTMIHKISYQITDSQGNTEQGQHPIVIPLTKLQIDRPGSNSIVDTDTVICAGVTDKGAEVTVNGKPVGVTALGFSTRVPLLNMGERRIDLTAHAPGKAPRKKTVIVTRIENISNAIEDWSTDLDRRLDYPTLGRNPNNHLDRKVKLSGRIVNINTEKGVTAFLLYVARGCPAGARCAVYAVFRGETNAGLQSWVNVFGRVKGSRAIDLPNGQQIEVPAVEAKFVVKKNRKRRKRSH